jgi:probable biosynthetic protein (TIGR04098 family)
MNYEAKLREILAALARRESAEISLDRRPAAYGLDSMALLVFREECERAFAVVIADEDWVGFESLGGLLNYLEERAAMAAAGSSAGETSAASRLWTASDMVEHLEIGMPLTGINQLSENALLKHLGDLRWRHIARLTGASSRNLVDSAGERLYPAFFFVHVQFPEPAGMAAYGENDRVDLVDTVARFGSSLLDGIAYIVPLGRGAAPRRPLAGMDDAVAHGVPAVRLSNAFVMQFNGAEWLRKSRPREDLIAGIPVAATPPDSYLLNKQAAERGYVVAAPPSFIPLHRCVFEYDIDPDRDVNGVGLLYFANYPLFLDLAERAALLSVPRPLDGALINRRSLTDRKIVYLNNASWRDSLRIESEISVLNPFLLDPDADLSASPVRIFSNQTAFRHSDGRPVCISSCEKTLHGVSLEETPWEEKLRALRTK